MSVDTDLLYDVQDRIATITLNRPEKMNALSHEMLMGWRDAIVRAQEDDGVRVVMLTGAGRGFCSGADVSTMRGATSVLGDVEAPVASNRHRMRFGVHRGPRALQDLDKPVIVAVNGAAVGAGMDLASMCDIRFASDRAKFSMAYVRMGLVPGDGGCYFLPRIIGMSKALELMWTGRMIDAQEALAIGYLNRVVPHDDLMKETRAFAEELARGPAASIQLTKRLALRSATASMHDALEMAEHAMMIVRTSEDSREGPRAFIEKREPHFIGE